MPKVVTIRFHGSGKTYHFDPAGLPLHTGDEVVAETSQGLVQGVVAEEVFELPEEKLVSPLRPVIRLATEADLARSAEHRQREREAYRVCQERIEARGLEMNLTSVEYSFEGNRIIFYFTADGRVDFRELVKDLASAFRTRIELRQIGVRDEARMTGGLGICGRELCCCLFLNDFVPVSIKMAKAQNLSMNPSKISGACGRLLCCLKYEQDAYLDAISRLPRQGALVKTSRGQGIVVGVNLLKETVDVRLDEGGETDLITFTGDEIEILSNRPIRKNLQNTADGQGEKQA